MTIRLCVVALIGLTAAAASAQSCPEQPPLADKRLKLRLEGSAKAIARVAGAEIVASVEKESKSILQAYPKADRLIVNMSLLSSFCQELRANRVLTTDQKTRRMILFRRELLN